MSVKENLENINRQIELSAAKFGHTSDQIRLIGVTKTIDDDKVLEGINAGIKEVGENRVQELVRKKDIFDGATVHMIGRLQTNKVKNLVGYSDLIQSVDRKNLIVEMERIGKRENHIFDCLLQINVAEEIQKGGMSEDELSEALEYVEELNFVKVRGLMMIAPFAENPEEIRWTFREMRKLFEKHKDIVYNNSKMEILSMGMSGDFQIALEEGANMVRIGSAIFGKRNYQI